MSALRHRNGNRAWLSTCILFLCLPGFAAELTLGLPRQENGLQVYDILLRPGDGDAIAGMQTGLSLPAGWTLVEVVPGVAAQRANKQVLFNEEGASPTLMVAGFNQVALGEGAVATLYVDTAGQDGSERFRLADAVLSGPAGEAVPVRMHTLTRPDPEDGKEDPLPAPAQPDAYELPAAEPPGGEESAPSGEDIVADSRNLALLAGILGTSYESAPSPRGAFKNKGDSLPGAVTGHRSPRPGPAGLVRPGGGEGTASRPRAPLALSQAIAGARGSGQSSGEENAVPGTPASVQITLAPPADMVTTPASNMQSAIARELSASARVGADGPSDSDAPAIPTAGLWMAALLVIALMLVGLLRGRFSQGS